MMIPTSERDAHAGSIRLSQPARDLHRSTPHEILDAVFDSATKQEPNFATSRAPFQLWHLATRPSELCGAISQRTWRALPQYCMYEAAARSEEHTSELQSLMRIPYAVFCL